MKDYEIYKLWKNNLPEVVYRSDWDQYKRYGLPYTRDYMAQLDSKGEGPKKAIMGGKVCYSRSNIISWYRHRRESVQHPGIQENMRTATRNKTKRTRG